MGLPEGGSYKAVNSNWLTHKGLTEDDNLKEFLSKEVVGVLFTNTKEENINQIKW